MKNQIFKPIFCILVINSFLALIYCRVFSKMNLESYAEALFAVGLMYLLFGGGGYLFRISTTMGYTEIFWIDPRKLFPSINERLVNLMIPICGISTLFLSYAAWICTLSI